MLATATRNQFPSNTPPMAVLPATSQPLPVHSLARERHISQSRDRYTYEDEPMSFVMRTGYGAPNFMPMHPMENPFSMFPNYALVQLLALENQFYADVSSLLGVDPIAEDKVDASMRDESLSRLRSLHRAYYDLSPITFCKAVCLVDTFITRVKVKPKYMMCVAAACYYIASKFETGKQLRPTVDSLVRLTRCGGSSDDLVRMVDIILTKLGPSTVTAIGAASATALDFLRLFLNTGDKDPECSDLPTFLIRQLEIALCTTNSAFFRPSCLALALLAAYKQNLPPVGTEDSESSAFQALQILSLNDLFTLANFCKVSWVDVDMCARTLFDNGTLESYSVSPVKSPASSSPEVVWNLSRRTKLNLSSSAQPSLKTITEWIEEEEE